jgi:hypothetical protein
MFALLSTLLEILASHSGRFFESRRTSRDTEVAGQLVRIVAALQDLCVRGERLLKLTDGFLDGTADAGHPAEFEGLLRQQVQTLDQVRTLLEESRGLLATVDVAIYLELAPFLDTKSGLLTRWEQQVAQSRFSTTTLFFLPADRLQRVIEAGQAQATSSGLAAERTEYVLVLADNLRLTRSIEVRDIRERRPHNDDRLSADIAAARVELSRAKELCAQLLASVDRVIGPEALARLRRQLLPKPS